MADTSRVHVCNPEIVHRATIPVLVLCLADLEVGLEAEASVSQKDGRWLSFQWGATSKIIVARFRCLLRVKVAGAALKTAWARLEQPPWS